MSPTRSENVPKQSARNIMTQIKKPVGQACRGCDFSCPLLEYAALPL